MKLHFATPGDTVMDGDLAPSRTSKLADVPSFLLDWLGSWGKAYEDKCDFTWGCGVRCCVRVCVFLRDLSVVFMRINKRRSGENRTIPMHSQAVTSLIQTARCLLACSPAETTKAASDRSPRDGSSVPQGTGFTLGRSLRIRTNLIGIVADSLLP